MEKIDVSVNFSDATFCKQYFKSFRGFIFDKILPGWIFLYLFTLLTLEFAWSDVDYQLYLLHTSVFFKVVCAEIILIILYPSIAYRLTNRLKKEILLLIHDQEIKFIFQSTEFLIYKGDVLAFEFEYNTLHKVQITTTGFFLVMPSKQSLFLPHTLFSVSERRQLTRWLKRR